MKMSLERDAKALKGLQAAKACMQWAHNPQVAIQLCRLKAHRNDLECQCAHTE